MMSEGEDASILDSNLTAVEAISAKLAEVTRLAEKLDAKLCEAGARTRPMSIPTAVTSSASSLLSISATSSPVTPSRTIAPASTAADATTSTTSAPVTAPIHPTSLETASAIISASPSSSATSTPITHKHQSQTESSTRAISTSTMSTDAGKPVASAAEKPDETSPRVVSHSTEDVQTSNKDFSSKEIVEHSRSESAAEEYNVESYATATECSSPIVRSRSESFVTSPECEDLAITTCTTPSCSGFTWWTTETPKLVTTTAPVAAATSNENQTLKVAETTSSVSTIGGIKPTARIETMDKITDERSGRIVKEVTETTVLRVSHDIRLGVASYKMTSNVVQDHRQHTDAREIQNVERVLPAESQREKTNGTHDLDLGASLIKDSEKYIEKCPRKVQSDQNISTKFTKVREHESSRSASGVKEYEDASLSTRDILRHHEDSGIEMSPMKKDDNSEGEDFLERARKL